MSTKSYGTKKPNNRKTPKKLLYKGEQHEVIRVDHSKGVYVLRSRSTAGAEIEVPFSEFLPYSGSAPR